MRKMALLLFLIALSLLAVSSQAQDANGPLSGRWLITTDFHGTPIYFKLQLAQTGDKLSGDFDGDKLEGTVKGNELHFLAKDDHGGSEDGTAKFSGNTMSGTFVIVYGDNPNEPET